MLLYSNQSTYEILKFNGGLKVSVYNCDSFSCFTFQGSTLKKQNLLYRVYLIFEGLSCRGEQTPENGGKRLYTVLYNTVHLFV